MARHFCATGMPPQGPPGTLYFTPNWLGLSALYLAVFLLLLGFIFSSQLSLPLAGLLLLLATSWYLREQLRCWRYRHSLLWCRSGQWWLQQQHLPLRALTLRRAQCWPGLIILELVGNTAATGRLPALCLLGGLSRDPLSRNNQRRLRQWLLLAV